MGKAPKAKRTARTPKKNARAKQRKANLLVADLTRRLVLFLDALRNTCNVRAACNAASVGRSTVYERRESDDTFKGAWDEAEQDGVDLLKAEARRRALLGVDEPVYYQGKRVGFIRRYSDALLMFLLKAHEPEVYRERYEVTGAGGGPVRHRLEVEEIPPTEAERQELTRIAGAIGLLPPPQGMAAGDGPPADAADPAPLHTGHTDT